MASKKDFVPDSVKNQRDWAKNIVDQGPGIIAGVEGWDAARIAAFVARVKKIQDAAQAILDAQSTLDTLGGALDTLLADELPEIRKDIGNLKKSRGWDDGKGDALEMNTPPASIDPNTVKPKIEVESKNGRNEVMVKKFGADSVNLKVRKVGEATFRLLAAKRVRFPMDDDTPSADGKPEAREYQAIAVIGDKEVGVPSDIASAVWRP
jgi:hypothetical protein